MEPRIGELLVRGGIVTREQLNEALEKEKSNGSHIVQELVRLGFTTEDQLTQFLAKQFGIEKVELADADIPDSVFNLVPSDLVQKHRPPFRLLELTRPRTRDRKSTRLNSSHTMTSRMPSSA